MVRYAVLICLCPAAMPCVAAEPVNRLPQPEYLRRSTDPAWLAEVVQFHGHLGPSVVAGARIGMAGLRAAGAKGYFDVEVTCEGPFARPPQACFLDGVQVGTGATLGKRTLHWVQSERIAVRVTNTRNGRTAELRPTPLLLGLLASFKPRPKVGAKHGTEARESDERLEALARKIAALPEKELLTTKIVDERHQSHR